MRTITLSDDWSEYDTLIIEGASDRDDFTVYGSISIRTSDIKSSYAAYDDASPTNRNLWFAMHGGAGGDDSWFFRLWGAQGTTLSIRSLGIYDEGFLTGIIGIKNPD